MDAQNGSKPPEDVLDLDAFAPVPTRRIIVEKKSYSVTSFFDVSAEDALKLLRIESDAAGKSIDEQLERLRQQVKILVPDLPQPLLAKLSWRKLVAITREAWLLARPQEALNSSQVTGPGADPSNPSDGRTESEPSSPATPVTTQGSPTKA